METKTVNSNRSVMMFVLMGILFGILFCVVCGLCFVHPAFAFLFLVWIGGYVAFCLMFYTSWINDVNTICYGDGDNTASVWMLILLSIVTVGVYTWIWQYNLQNRLASNAHRYNVYVPETGSTVLLWNIAGAFLFGAGPFIAMNIMLKSTNKLAFMYNQYGLPTNGGGYQQYQGYQGGNPGYPSQGAPMPPQGGAYPPQQSMGQGAMPPQGGAQNIFGQGGQLANPFEQPAMNVNPFAATPAAPPMSTPAPAPAPKPQAASTATGLVQVISGSAKGKGFKLVAGSKVVVGKNPSKANLVIDAGFVSNVHCIIQYNPQNNTYMVTDLSSNGTLANGKKLSKNVATTVKAGTVLSLVDDKNQIKLG